jgi:hypothetical protein
MAKVVRVVGDLEQHAIQSGEGELTIVLDGGSSSLVLMNDEGTQLAYLGRLKFGDPAMPSWANDGGLLLKTSDGNDVIRLDGTTGEVSAGGIGKPGRLRIRTQDGHPFVDCRMTVVKTAPTAEFALGGKGNVAAGVLMVRDEDGKDWLQLNGLNRTVRIGGEGKAGSLQMVGATNQPRVVLGEGNLTLGGNGTDGDINLYPASLAIPGGDPGKATISLDGASGGVTLRASNDKEMIWLNAATGSVRMTDKNGANVFAVELGALFLGCSPDLQGAPGSVYVRNSQGSTTITIDGEQGDIALSGGDCAEEFQGSAVAEGAPGTVMVIGEDGSLRESDAPYDTKVAGIVSGAGDNKPGIVLGKRFSTARLVPIALTGTAYCKVDADCAPVEAGDLLTTSPTLGHAMKATDRGRASGAIIGKALRPLNSGRGLVPVLVALQ